MPGASMAVLAQETVFYLRINPVQPSLGMVSLLLLRRNFGLKLLDPVFGCMKLMRQLLRSVHCLPIVAFGNFRRPSDKLQNRLAGPIKLSVITFSFSTRTSEWNDVGTFPVLFLTTHG
jgi:hypothetical protein